MNLDQIDEMLKKAFGASTAFAYANKHVITKAALRDEVRRFFLILLPLPEVVEQLAPGGKCGISAFKTICRFCATNPLKKCILLNKEAQAVVMEQVEQRGDNDLGAAEYEAQLAGGVLDAEQLVALRESMVAGRLKKPHPMGQVVADIICTLLGRDCVGSWSKFRMMMVSGEALELFTKYDRARMTRSRLISCLELKRNHDRGIVTLGESRRRASMRRPVAPDRSADGDRDQVHTLCEAGLLQHCGPEIVPLYAWARALVHYYSRYAGREGPQQNLPNWEAPVGFHVYWD